MQEFVDKEANKKLSYYQEVCELFQKFQLLGYSMAGGSDGTRGFNSSADLSLIEAAIAESGLAFRAPPVKMKQKGIFDFLLVLPEPQPIPPRPQPLQPLAKPQPLIAADAQLLPAQIVGQIIANVISRNAKPKNKRVVKRSAVIVVKDATPPSSTDLVTPIAQTTVPSGGASTGEDLTQVCCGKRPSTSNSGQGSGNVASKKVTRVELLSKHQRDHVEDDGHPDKWRKLDGTRKVQATWFEHYDWLSQSKDGCIYCKVC